MSVVAVWSRAAPRAGHIRLTRHAEQQGEGEGWNTGCGRAGGEVVPACVYILACGVNVSAVRYLQELNVLPRGSHRRYPSACCKSTTSHSRYRAFARWLSSRKYHVISCKPHRAAPLCNGTLCEIRYPLTDRLYSNLENNCQYNSHTTKA